MVIFYVNENKKISLPSVAKLKNDTWSFSKTESDISWEPTAVVNFNMNFREFEKCEKDEKIWENSFKACGTFCLERGTESFLPEKNLYNLRKWNGFVHNLPENSFSRIREGGEEEMVKLTMTHASLLCQKLVHTQI